MTPLSIISLDQGSMFNETPVPTEQEAEALAAAVEARRAGRLNLLRFATKTWSRWRAQIEHASRSTALR